MSVRFRTVSFGAMGALLVKDPLQKKGRMAKQAATLTRQRTGIRYGWHDRYRIPLDHPAALRFYLENLFVPHSRREMLWAAVARASARAGRAALPLLGMSAAERLKGRAGATGANLGGAPEAGGADSDALVRVLAARLGEAGLPFEGGASAITLDDYRHSDRGKMVIFLFERGARTPCAVVKLTRNPEHGAALGREHEALRALHARLDEGLRHTLPRPLAALEEGELTAFAEGYVPGRSMYFEMRNTWLPRRRADFHFRLARRWLVQFQQATRAGEERLAGSVAAEQVTGPLKDYQRAFAPEAGVRKFISEVIRKAHALRGETFPLVAGQGDFWARNLIVRGGQLSVLDWEGYAERASPFSDLLLFATSYGLSYPWRIGRWAEPEVAFRATLFGAGWMARLVRRHLLGYCDDVGVSPKLLEVYFPAFLAERALEERARGRRAKTRAASRAGRKGLVEGGGTWDRLFQEYASLEGRACFGS